MGRKTGGNGVHRLRASPRPVVAPPLPGEVPDERRALLLDSYPASRAYIAEIAKAREAGQSRLGARRLAAFLNESAEWLASRDPEHVKARKARFGADVTDPTPIKCSESSVSAYLRRAHPEAFAR